MYKSYCYVKLFPPWSWRNLNYSYMQGYEICYFCFLKQLKMWILFILDNGEISWGCWKWSKLNYWTPIVIYIAKENYNKVAVYLIYSTESLAVEIKLRSLHTQSPLKNAFWLNHTCWYQRKTVIKVIYPTCRAVHPFWTSWNKSTAILSLSTRPVMEATGHLLRQPSTGARLLVTLTS